ncbi:MAG: hypothetical protein FWE97_01845 [Dehalococcoidia bacterium]|nr:hypothetical protein [Dehalococcoidia bacterium]
MFHIKLDGSMQTSGVILCDQVRALDIRTGNAVYKESVADDILEQVIDLVCSFIERDVRRLLIKLLHQLCMINKLIVDSLNADAVKMMRINLLIK